jgi:hypothetical protein
VRHDLAVELAAEYVLDAAADDLFLGEAEPFGVAAIRELVDLVAADVGDQRRNRVDDQLEPFLAAPEGSRNLVDLGVGVGEPRIGPSYRSSIISSSSSCSGSSSSLTSSASMLYLSVAR